MTPAILAAKRAKIDFTIHEYEHDSTAESYGLEAAEKLGLDAAHVYKTLVTACATGELVVAILPVDKKLDLKLLAKACGAKKANMAEVRQVERATGYVMGGVSPLGQKKRLRTIIDESARKLNSIFVSAGRRGLEIELAPTALAELTKASFAAVSR